MQGEAKRIKNVLDVIVGMQTNLLAAGTFGRTETRPDSNNRLISMVRRLKVPLIDR